MSKDELFHCLEGEFIEVAEERYRLAPGDSLLAPRLIPHVWAYVGDRTAKLLIAFSPAGKMQAFFDEISKTHAMPSQDPTLWLEHGMKVLGPPLPV